LAPRRGWGLVVLLLLFSVVALVSFIMWCSVLSCHAVTIIATNSELRHASVLQLVVIASGCHVTQRHVQLG